MSFKRRASPNERRRERERHKRNTIPRLKSYIRSLKERPCADCKVQYPFYVMQFDHLPGFVKKREVSKHGSKSWKFIATEAAKCEVVCANCHAERSWRRQQHIGPKQRLEAVRQPSLFDQASGGSEAG